MGVKVVTDSTADVPLAFVERYGLQVVPALIIIEGKEYRDGVDVTREEFYRRMPTLRPLPTTAAPSSGMFEEAYTAAGTADVISIHTAKALSGIYNAARLGAEKFGDRVKVIDTGLLAMGVGWHVITAAAAAAQGATLAEVLAVVEAVHARIRLFALLDTLENLRHSGRISLMRASVGALLQIKPMLEVTDGMLVPRAQYRTRSKSLPGFIDFLKTLGQFERLAVHYTDDIEPAQQLREALRGQVAEEPLVVQVTPTIGTNIGPYAVGVAGILK